MSFSEGSQLRMYNVYACKDLEDKFNNVILFFYVDVEEIRRSIAWRSDKSIPATTKNGEKKQYS